MKQFFLGLLLICTGVCYAQQKNIEIDFKEKEIKIPTKTELRDLRTVKVVVNNLPAKAYKVNINKTDSFVSIGTPPPLFNVMSFGDGFNSLLAGLAGYTIRNAGPMMVDNKEAKKWTNEIKKLKEEDFDVKGKDTLSEFLFQYACDYSVKSFMPVIERMRTSVFNFHYEFRDHVIRKTDSLVYLYNLSAIKADIFKSEAEKIIFQRFALEKRLEVSYKTYYDTILPLYTSVTKCIPLAAADSMLTAYKKSFFLFLNKYDTTFNETIIAKVYSQLKPKPQLDTFYSLPYRLKADITKFSIDISAIDPTKVPQSFNTFIELEKHPNRLWSFTSGVFLSKLINHDFSIRTNVQQNAQNPLKKDTLNYSILQEQNNKVSAGINALMHIGTYLGDQKETGVYLAFGPGLTLEKTPQVRAFIGGGVMFGRTNKLALTFGWTGGLVKRLSANYKLSDTYNPAPVDITRDRFKGGGFFSIGYSLLGK